ncbi:MAG: cbb3-type cytochrome c oxidase subunit 3 [Pseudomonadota bacterium]
METYTWLREFADSWFLIAMTAFFVGMILWTLRPGSRAKHADLADIPLRNDERPLEEVQERFKDREANDERP